MKDEKGEVLKKKRSWKRKAEKGSMTLEAAVVLPVFLILFMNLFSAMEQYRIHSCVMFSLWQQGRSTMQYAYLEDRLGQVESEIDVAKLLNLGGNAVSWVQTRRKLVENLDQFMLWRQLVTFQENGLVLRTTRQGDMIDLQCSYFIHPLFSGFTFSNHMVTAKFYGHAFTGYNPSLSWVDDEKETNEDYVFVTKTGTTYHENRSCSYLNPSIHVVATGDIEEQRNESGGKYYPCAVCAKDQSVALLYVTDYGTSYHCSTACTSLKRTIYEIKRSEIGGRSPCKKCSGGL